MTRRRVMTRTIPVLSLTLTVLVGTSVRAEVRLRVAPEDGAVKVQVKETRSGPWTLVGASDELVLNPSGDALGDGFPGRASRGDEALVAWVQPRSSSLRLTAARNGRWSEGRNLGTDGAPAGVPRVGALDTGWAMAWLSDAQAGRTRVIGLDRDLNPGEAEDQLLIEGRLLDAITREGVTHVLTVNGADIDLTSVLWSTVPGVPKPIDTLNLNSLVRWDEIAGIPVILATTTREDEAATLLAWRETTGAVSYLVLTDEGPEFPSVTLDAKLNKPLLAVLRSAGVLRGKPESVGGLPDVPGPAGD